MARDFLFAKPLGQITVDDIARMCTEGMPEGADLEFKQSLSSKDGKTDLWASEGTLSDHAKNKMLREIIALP